MEAGRRCTALTATHPAPRVTHPHLALRIGPPSRPEELHVRVLTINSRLLSPNAAFHRPDEREMLFGGLHGTVLSVLRIQTHNSIVKPWARGLLASGSQPRHLSVPWGWGFTCKVNL